MRLARYARATARGLDRAATAITWPLDRLADWHVPRVLRYERALVEDGPEAERGLFRRDMARSALYMVAALGVPWLPDDSLWKTLGCAVLGGMVGSQAIKLTQRASAYRSGWLDGRKRFVVQAEHHRQQGNEPREWLQTEVEHDVINVFGARVEFGDERREGDDT